MQIFHLAVKLSLHYLVKDKHCLNVNVLLFIYLFIYLFFIIKIVHMVQQSKRAIKLIRIQQDLTNSKLTINR